MATSNYLTAVPLSEITRYRSGEDYRREGVAYRGVVRKHPYDRTKLLLITSPFDDLSRFYEFRLTDVLHAEEDKCVTSESGESVEIMEVWIRRGSVAIALTAFEVQ